MNYLKNISLLLLFVFTTSLSFAQNDNDKKQLENLIKNTVKINSASLTEEGIEEMMSHYRPDVIISITRIEVDGTRKRNMMRKGDYRAIFINQYNQNVQRESTVNIKSTRIQGKTAVVDFDLDYELVNSTSNKVLSKGFESINAIFIKKKGKWYVLELNVIDIEVQKFQGVCYCEIYKNANTGSVIAKVGAPKGDRFENKLNNVYQRVIGGKTYFSVQGVIFEWADKKDIWTVDSDLKRVEKLKSSKDQDDAILIILKYLYKNECTEMSVIK
ncbi:hypothetical protein [Flammeovirga kamogawensis]|uniref:Nuclear transport factor 2 family protein n=1 Tax=Flammeovirga kamogawensis TaxID=373891 RepID=A0ABX8H005_9BACT|nr:hypothetical protein [Flammeovirga kamogawensis]MBB6459433.1 hypothetical protein [Flammeovirga kamogawensis]QWG08988.1 hypothetical protein KM029_08595 [Flammeovirga kamogawensis]TRX67278.1 hypothetical protein EO216_03640 [Flammeovirga kamogawensis]